MSLHGARSVGPDSWTLWHLGEVVDTSHFGVEDNSLNIGGYIILNNVHVIV